VHCERPVTKPQRTVERLGVEITEAGKQNQMLGARRSGTCFCVLDKQSTDAATAPRRADEQLRQCRVRVIVGRSRDDLQAGKAYDLSFCVGQQSTLHIRTLRKALGSAIGTHIWTVEQPNQLGQRRNIVVRRFAHTHAIISDHA
jgi:hypothetical protein